MRSVTMASAASVAVGSSLTVRESLDRARSPRASCAAARHADRVLEEDAVELGRLGDLRDVGVALEVHVVGRDGVGMAPAGEMVARHAEEAAEPEHALAVIGRPPTRSRPADDAAPGQHAAGRYGLFLAEPVLRDRHAEIAAEGRALVLGAEAGRAAAARGSPWSTHSSSGLG